jgi:hypothetical protein
MGRSSVTNGCGRVDARLQYGGEILERACGLEASLRRPSPAAVGNARALLAVLRGLPRLPVELSDGISGRVIEQHLRATRLRIPKNRLLQGVMPLPTDEQAYLRDGSRIVRRQVHRARAAGNACARLASHEERWEIVRQLTPQVPGMPRWVDRLPGRLSDQWWVVRDGAERPLGFAIVVVAGEWAMLELLISIEHPARYLLHTEIVTALGAAGARYMLTDSPGVLRMDPHLRSFQRVLGYRVAHLSLRKR